jgi:hypothetical protein
VLQPVIQFGTAIHGESFSGGALNRVQKLRRVGNNVSVLRKNWKSTDWILANRGVPTGVAAVTAGQVVPIVNSAIPVVASQTIDAFDSWRSRHMRGTEPQVQRRGGANLNLGEQPQEPITLHLRNSPRLAGSKHARGFPPAKLECPGDGALQPRSTPDDWFD